MYKQTWSFEKQMLSSKNSAHSLHKTSSLQDLIHLKDRHIITKHGNNYMSDANTIVSRSCC